MERQWILAAGLVVVIAAFIYTKWDDKRTTISIPLHTDVAVRSTSSKITFTTKTDRLSVPNYGHGIDIVQHGGIVTYKPITHGWPVTPGFSTDFQRVGLSLEIGFYKRLSLIAGSNFFNLRTQQWDVRFHGGIAYRLPWGALDNISVYSGISSSGHITGGVFVRFGGN